MKRRKLRKFRLFIVIFFLIFLGLGLLFLWPRDVDPSLFLQRQGRMYYLDPGVETRTGIDVSSHQEQIDWEQVSKDGIDFAMIRCGYRGATEGKLYEDPYYEQNVQQALKYGLDVGIYFYSTAINEEELQEEIEFVISQAEKFSLTYPIAYDMEFYGEDGGRIQQLNSSEKTQMALTFCQAMENQGYETLIYGNIHWLEQELDAQAIADHEIWYAAYQDAPALARPFRFWQYSQSGSVKGIEGPVDLNIEMRG